MAAIAAHTRRTTVLRIRVIGHGLVPADSQKLYAFKVIQTPVAVACTLSTGTIYISTGLISLTDNEAQLAYILSH